MADEVKPKLHTGPSGEKLVETGEREIPKIGQWFMSDDGDFHDAAGEILQRGEIDSITVPRRILRPATPEEAEAAEREPHTCKKPTDFHLIAGASWYSCVLPSWHEGPCKPGGKCLVHGPYVCDGYPIQCPKWPDCVKDQLAMQGAASVSLSGVREPQPPDCHPGCGSPYWGNSHHPDCARGQWEREHEPVAPPPSPQSARFFAEHWLKDNRVRFMTGETVEMSTAKGQWVKDVPYCDETSMLTEFAEAYHAMRLSSGKGEPGPGVAVLAQAISKWADEANAMNGGDGVPEFWEECETSERLARYLKNESGLFPSAPSPHLTEIHHGMTKDCPTPSASGACPGHKTWGFSGYLEVLPEVAAPSPQPERPLDLNYIRDALEAIASREVCGCGGTPMDGPCIACQVEHSLEILKAAQPPDPEALAERKFKVGQIVTGERFSGKGEIISIVTDQPPDAARVRLSNGHEYYYPLDTLNGVLREDSAGA